MKIKRLLGLLFIGSCLASTLTVAACANKPEPEEDNSLILYTFEQGIWPVAMDAEFGSLDINENTEFVKNGERSLVLRPETDGISDPLMYFPFASNVLAINYTNGDKISNVKFWCYAPKAMSINAGLYFSSFARKRSLPIEVELQQGWNEVVYTLDHATLAVMNDMKNVQGFYLSFPKESVPASEGVALYIDDLAITKLDKELEYTPNYPEIVKETGDVITFGSIVFGSSETVSGSSDWLDGFEGAQGVLQLEASTAWPVYRNRTFWKPAYEKAYYEDYTHIVIRAYATGACDAWYQLEDRTDGVIEYGMTFKEDMTGRWVDFVMPIENFVTHFDRFITEGQFMAYAESKVQVYIDSIRAVNPIEKEYASSTTDVREGEEFDLTVSELAEDYPEVAFRYAVNGVYAENPSKYVFEKAGDYTVCFEGVFEGKLVRGEYALNVKVYGEQIETADVAASGGETVNLVPTQLNDAKYNGIAFVFTVNGIRVSDPSEYTLPEALGRYSVKFEGRAENGYLYYGSYLISVGNKDEVWADVMTFETSATAPTSGDVTEAEWLAEYAGANGVLKMHVGVWKGYQNQSEWKPVFGKSVYDNYTHLAFRVRVEGFTGNNFKCYYKVEGTGGATAVEYELEFTSDTNGWTTVYLPIDKLRDNLDGFAQKTQIVFLNNPESNNTQTYFYLDSIRAVNYQEETARPAVITPQTGDTVDLTVAELATKYDGVQFTYAVNGIAISNPSEYVFASAGEYTVSYSGILNGKFVYGEYSLTVAVRGTKITVADKTGKAGRTLDLVPQELKNNPYGEITFTFKVEGVAVANPSEYTLPDTVGNYKVTFEGYDASGDFYYGEYTLRVEFYGEEIEVEDIATGAGSQISLVPQALSDEKYSGITFAFKVDGDTVANPNEYTVPASLGRYEITFEGRRSDGYLYYGSYLISVGNKDEVWADVMTFETSATAPTSGDVTEAEWLAEHEGAKGVLKMHVGVWKGYQNKSEWKPVFGKSVYDNYTHLAFRVRVEGFAGNNFKLYYKVEGTGGATAVEYELEFTANTNGWTTVYLPIDKLRDNLDGFAQKTQIVFLNNPESNNTQTYFYLDSIRAVNYESVDYAPSNLTAASGEAFNLVPEELKMQTEITYYVNGVKVDVPNTYMIAEEGSYNVVYDGIYNHKLIQGSYTVKAYIDGRFLLINSSTVNTTTGSQYMNEYEGVKNVVKVGTTNGWSQVMFAQFAFNAADYAAYDTLTLKVWTDTAQIFQFSGNQFSGFGDVRTLTGGVTQEQTGQWVTLTIQGKDVIENLLASSSGERAFDLYNAQGNVYLADFILTKSGT